MQLDVVRTRGQNQLMVWGLKHSPNRDLLHINCRFPIVVRQPRKVEHRQTLQCCGPQLAVAAGGQSGETSAAFRGIQPIAFSEVCVVWRSLPFLRPPLEGVRRGSGNAIPAEPLASLELQHSRKIETIGDTNQPIGVNAEESARPRVRIEPPERIFPKHLIVVGARNSGNSHKTVPRQTIDSTGGGGPDNAPPILVQITGVVAR
jgi:hypothetical protein